MSGNDFDNRLTVFKQNRCSNIFKFKFKMPLLAQKCQNNVAKASKYNLSKYLDSTEISFVKICCFSLLYVTVNLGL